MVTCFNAAETNPASSLASRTPGFFAAAILQALCFIDVLTKQSVKKSAAIATKVGLARCPASPRAGNGSGESGDDGGCGHVGGGVGFRLHSAWGRRICETRENA